MIPPVERAVDAARDLAAYGLAWLADRAMAPSRCDHTHDAADVMDQPEPVRRVLSDNALRLLMSEAISNYANGDGREFAVDAIMADLLLDEVIVDLQASGVETP